jgi:hypothetical protein
MAVVAWEPEPVELTADEAMLADVGKGANKERDRARAWLRKTLHAGPMPAADVYAQGRANGFRDKSIWLAFEDLGGQRKKSHFKGGWLWWLPSDEDAHSGQREPSEPSQKHEDFDEDSEDSHSSPRESSEPSQKHEVCDEDSEDSEYSHSGPRESSAPSQKHEDSPEDSEDALGQRRESSDDDEWGEV